MQAREGRSDVWGWFAAHAVDAAFALLAAGWLLYILRITRELSFWSDDLFLLDQAGSWRGLIEPYNDHLSVVILSIYRAAAEVGGLSYTPFMIAGALSLLSVPVAYFATTRRMLGPPVAAVLALSLLWYVGIDVRPYGLNHDLALLGGVICAAALNRGRRADLVLATALTFSLLSAGGGVAVAAACLVHNLLARAPLRRWVAVLAPSVVWTLWWLFVAGAPSLSSAYRLSPSEAARVVRDLVLSPFYDTALDVRLLAMPLMVGFFLHGALQLRRGLAAGANFVAWSAAMVLWALALVRSRGLLAEPGQFRYAYLSLGFALLAVVPAHPIRWPTRPPFTTPRWAGTAAVIVLFVGATRAVAARDDLQDFVRGHAERGRQAKGTMLVLGLEPELIPDQAPMSFFGIFTTHGTAGQVRAMIDLYGSPFDSTIETADQDLVDLDIARARLGRTLDFEGCRPLTAPLQDPGLADHGRVEPVAGSSASPLRLWSNEPFTIRVRRFGRDWVRLADVPGGRVVKVILPVLNTDRAWEVRAEGACELTSSRSPE